MSDCPYKFRLDALHDGELDPQERREIEMHVQNCPACGVALVEIRRMAALFEPLKGERLSGEELARVHAAMDEPADGPSVLRIATVLTGLAASVLIIGAAWLREMPSGSRANPTIVRAPAVAPAWERVAMTLQTDPLPFQPWQARAGPALADARLADWMLEDLTIKAAHEKH